MSNMADSAAARREARRKKILENSHNRLQIISGKSSDECIKDSPIKTLISEPENDNSATLNNASTSSSTTIQNGILFNQPELLQLISRSRDIDATGSGDGDIDSELASFLQPHVSALQGLGPPTEPAEAATAPTSIWQTIVAYKYDIVLLSLILQILFGLSLLKFDNGYFFLPVIVYIVTKLIWFPEQNSSGLANILMLLNGMSPIAIQRLLFFTQLFGAVTRDIFVYLFTTIIVQSLLNMSIDSLVT